MNGRVKFISDLRESCEKHGVKLFMIPEKHIVFKGDKFGGWFDPDTMELHCAYRPWSTNQLELLVHESCHLDQHIKRTKIWTDALRFDAWNKWGDWMDGKEFDKQTVKTFMRLIQLAEMECEQMSVKKIRKYGLPIDIDNYRAKANSYILFYTLMLETRKWVETKGPYKFPSIIKQMPRNKILTTFDMSDELKQLYISKVYRAT